MININKLTGEVLGASIEIQKGVNVTLPEGLWPFARLASRDRAKNQHTLCELCVSVVNMFSNESREGRVGRLASCVSVPQALRVEILKA